VDRGLVRAPPGSPQLAHVPHTLTRAVVGTTGVGWGSWPMMGARGGSSETGRREVDKWSGPGSGWVVPGGSDDATGGVEIARKR
jgi:hypothetical protein